MPDRANAPARAWQRMLSGRRLDLLDPSPLDVEVEDIAHGLARVARWNGQTRGDHAFSVAQHSLLVDVALCADGEATAPMRLAALLHDAPEYVIGDLISPFKAVIDDTYREIETRLHRAVRLRFGLPVTLSAALQSRIKRADQAAAWFEATRLAEFSETEAVRYFGRPIAIEPERLAALIEPWPATRAERMFLKAFRAVERAAAEAA